MGVRCGGNLRAPGDRATGRCSRLFPCLSDPDRRSALSLRAALVALHLVFAGVLFLFDNDLIEKTKQEPWYSATYVFWFVATLIQYFLTSVTSPGFVLDAQKDVDEREASVRRSLLVSKQPASINGSVVVTVDGRNCSRENAIAWTKLVMDLYPQGTPTRNLTCPYCNVLQPPRAKHCHDCDKCVLQFDHHCVWLGTCIGQRNHCRFWWYIFEETALCLWMTILYIGYLKSNISKAWWVDVIMILLVTGLSMSLIFLLLLLLFHSYLFMTNQTTYELVRRRRIVYLRRLIWSWDFAEAFPKECTLSVKESAGICTCSVVLEVALIGWNHYHRPMNSSKCRDHTLALMFYLADAADVAETSAIFYQMIFFLFKLVIRRTRTHVFAIFFCSSFLCD